jgi:hypothetical protein
MAFEPAPTRTIVADATTFNAGPLVNVPDFDPIDTLPAACAEKLRMLRQRAADMHRVVPEFDDLQDLNIEKIKVEGEVRRLLASPHDGGFNLKVDDHKVLSAQKRLNKLVAEVKRLTELRDARSQTWRVSAGVLRAVEEFLRGKPPGTALETVELEEAPKREGILDGIARLRRRGRELQADLQRVRAAPLPSADAKKRMREQVQHWATRAGSNVAALVEHGDAKIEFQRELLRVQIHNIQAPAAVGYTQALDPLALLAWLDPSALIRRLDEEIDGHADDKAALSYEVRAQREANVLSDLIAVESAEASLIWQGISQGLPCEHRVDCAPQAILGCSLVHDPARALPSPESSLEHAFGVVGR